MRRSQDFSYPSNLEETLYTLRPALVLVDMLPGFLSDFTPKTVNLLVENQIRVMTYASRLNLPLAVLEFEGYGKTIPTLEGAARRLLNVKYFSKDCNNGFTSNQFKTQIETWNPSSLFFMGVNANCCVLDTAKAGHDFGYTPLTSECVIAESGASECVIDESNGLPGLYRARDWFKKNGIYLGGSSENT